MISHIGITQRYGVLALMPPPTPTWLIGTALRSQRLSKRRRGMHSHVTCLSLLLLVSGCDALNAEAYVQCTGSLAGVTCSVTRRSGSARATACWDVHFTCANGRESTARACHRVPDGREAMSSRLIPWADFKGFDACDTVSATSVENIVITAD